jgi:hypothetical protein
MAEVWLLLATEMVWWVIFALLMLVGRPVWTIASTCGKWEAKEDCGKLRWRCTFSGSTTVRF